VYFAPVVRLHGRLSQKSPTICHVACYTYSNQPVFAVWLTVTVLKVGCYCILCNSSSKLTYHSYCDGCVGVSALPGAFTDEVLEKMASFNTRPIIFPLSNPTSKSECTAEQAYQLTEVSCHCFSLFWFTFQFLWHRAVTSKHHLLLLDAVWQYVLAFSCTFQY